MSIAHSFSNFIDLTRDDNDLFALGCLDYQKVSRGVTEVGPINIVTFNDWSATVRFGEEYWIADSPADLGIIMEYLVLKHPYLITSIEEFNRKAEEAKA